MPSTDSISTTAVSADNLEIPLIDFSQFLHGDAESKAATARAVLAGFQRAGFIYLTGHGIASEAVGAAFAHSAAFFARPREQKEALAWTTPQANRGYSPPGREKTTALTDAAAIAAQRALEGADLKESFEIGKEGEPGLPNRWPDGFDDEGVRFRDGMLRFGAACKELYREVMRAIAVGMGLQEAWFDGYTDGGDNTLRLLHYPEVSHEVFRENGNTVRAGAHTDYGSITLLFQDMRGGLQVQAPTGRFVDATPVQDSIVVNAGDLLARWSNDTIRSTTHRVVEPPTQSAVHPPRYSMAYFCNPNFDRFIDAIPGTFGQGAADKKYAGINSGDYLVQRLAATY